MLFVILHNIRSAENVGSIFRTADAVGVSKLYVTGYTPAPVDRFGRSRRDVAKSALGAEKTVPWEVRRSATALVRSLRRSGVRVVAVEQDARSRSYRTLRQGKDTAFLFGNEVTGLPPSLLRVADAVIEIPMFGKTVRHARHPRHTLRGKESLNVAVAAGIVLFAAPRR